MDRIERARWLANTPPHIVASLLVIARAMSTTRDLQLVVAVDTLQDYVAQLRKELAAYAETVTTGGPPPPFTPGWERGDSSRPPTAPPEEEPKP